MPKARKSFSCDHPRTFGTYCHTCKGLEDGTLEETSEGIRPTINPETQARKQATRGANPSNTHKEPRMIS